MSIKTLGDLFDCRQFLVDALGFAIDKYNQNIRLSVFCRRAASASLYSVTTVLPGLLSVQDAEGSWDLHRQESPGKE